MLDLQEPVLKKNRDGVEEVRLYGVYYLIHEFKIPHHSYSMDIFSQSIVQYVLIDTGDAMLVSIRGLEKSQTPSGLSIPGAGSDLWNAA